VCGLVLTDKNEGVYLGKWVAFKVLVVGTVACTRMLSIVVLPEQTSWGPRRRTCQNLPMT